MCLSVAAGSPCQAQTLSADSSDTLAGFRDTLRAGVGALLRQQEAATTSMAWQILQLSPTAVTGVCISAACPCHCLTVPSLHAKCLSVAQIAPQICS